MQTRWTAFQLRKQVERAERRPGEVEVTALGQRHVQVLIDLRRGGPEASVMSKILSRYTPGSKPMIRLGPPASVSMPVPQSR